MKIYKLIDNNTYFNRHLNQAFYVEIEDMYYMCSYFVMQVNSKTIRDNRLLFDESI